MSCPGAEIFVDYVAGSLDSTECEALERHLEECTACRQLARAQKSIWCALDEFPPAVASEDFDRHLYLRIAHEGEPHWWHFFLRPQFSGLGVRRAVPVTVACLTLLAVFLFRSPLTPPQVLSHPVAIEQKVDVEQVERTLDDLDMLKQLTPDSQS